MRPHIKYEWLLDKDNTGECVSNEEEASDPFIIQNAICTPSGHYLISSSRHDYKTHKDANGHTYMVDGGYDYYRGLVNKGVPDENLRLESDTPFEEVRNKLLWGSYGKNRDEPLHWIRLKDMEENHIVSVMKMIENDSSERAKWRHNMMREELKYRKLKLIGKQNQQRQ
jgi:hypothetical protein